MDQVVDLDAAAAVLADRLDDWRSQGLDVGHLTWGHVNGRELTTDRAQARSDYSVGVRVRRGHEEGALVLFAGGWCDMEYWSGTADAEPTVEAPGWDDWLDVERFARIIDRFERFFGIGV